MFACHASNQCGLDGNRTSLIRKNDYNISFINVLDFAAHWILTGRFDLMNGACVCVFVVRSGCVCIVK